MTRHARPNKRSADEDARKLRSDLLPTLGRKAADEISKSDIVRAVNTIADRGAGVAANRTLALLRKMYNWGCREGIVHSNPVADIEMRVKEDSRDRVLADDELKRLWDALNREGFESTTADALRLQLLIGARIREVTDMRVGELQLCSDPIWCLPKRRAKGNRDVVRPLAPQSLALLLPRVEGKTPAEFVFASSHNSLVPITPRAPAQAVRRAAERNIVTGGWTPHDLRRTVATKFASLGVNEAVTKRILGHAPPTKDVLASVYDRYSYLPEMRSALERWEAHLADLVARPTCEALVNACAA